MKMVNKAYLDAWIEYVYNDWFNNWYLSSAPNHNKSWKMPPSSVIRIQQLNELIRRGGSRDEILASVDCLLRMCGFTAGKDTAAEIQLVCAVAIYKLGDFSEALKLLNEAVGGFTGLLHPRAVALWINGCILWLWASRIDAAIMQWEDSWESFSKSLDKDRIWYEPRIRIMRETIDAATRNGAPPPPPSLRPAVPAAARPPRRHPKCAPGAHRRWKNPPAPGGASGTPPAGMHIGPTAFSIGPSTYNPNPPGRARLGGASLRSYPIRGEIRAGEFYNVFDPPGEETLGRMEVSEVEILGERYEVFNLREGALVNLSQGNQNGYFILRVKGHSMRTSSPVQIRNGDYVLMRQQDTAQHMDIVAAEIIGPDEGATLKRYRVENNLPRLYPESDHPDWQTPMDLRPEWVVGRDFRIVGVALAVFKKPPV
jgi:hypothetical protein